MQSETSPAKFQSLASAVKSLDVALKAHLDTMNRWYATQNIFADSLIFQGSTLTGQERSDQEAPSTPKQGNNANNNNIDSDTLTLSAQFGSRMRMRRNTKIPVAFDETAISKLRRPSAHKVFRKIWLKFLQI